MDDNILTNNPTLMRIAWALNDAGMEGADRIKYAAALLPLFAEIRTAALEEAAVIAEDCLLIPDSETEAYNEAVTDVISALRAAEAVEHEHDPGGCTCGCPVDGCPGCGGA